jgi:hypothetical protein
MSLLGGERGFIESKNDYLLLAYTNTEIATEDQYQAWWKEFSDISSIQGLSDGIRVVSEKDQRPGQKTKWKYLVTYGFSGDANALKTAVTGHKMKDDSALWLYEGIGPLTQKVWKETDTEEHIFMALTNVKPGREEDFHEWYNRHHIPDIVSVSVYRSGRRFEIAATSGAEAPWRFLAFYRFVGPALEMHSILRDEVTQYQFAHTDAYEENDNAWIYSVI